MCEAHVEPGLTRRRFVLLGATGVATGLLFPKVAATQDTPEIPATPIGSGHVILPREVWGADLPANGPMESEAPEDVRFLLVHHSASGNNYSADQSAGLLRGFYNFHTSAQKGWPDIAYNFLVDRYGQIFEGRTGSIAAPVKGDATGGSQGFALLCCFIGNHTEVAPTTEAQSAMVALLAWLADTYEIDPSPGTSTEFVSRGSNRHPKGTTVVTPTITGHRTMSKTACPGDAAFELVEHSFPALIASVTQTARPTTTSTTTSSTVPEASSEDLAPDTTLPTTTVDTSTTAPPSKSESAPSPPSSTTHPPTTTVKAGTGSEPLDDSAGIPAAPVITSPPKPPAPTLPSVSAETMPQNSVTHPDDHQSSNAAAAAAPAPDARPSSTDDLATRLGIALVAVGATMAALPPTLWLGRRLLAASQDRPDKPMSSPEAHQPFDTSSPASEADRGSSST